MENSALRKGYVMVPRALLVEMFESHGEASGDEEAFLRLLVYVNYKSVNVSIPSGKMLICGRGESMMSFAHWERILGWSHGRVRRFFGDCFRLGSLERVNDGCRSHIRIPGYDVWTASASEQTKHDVSKENRHTANTAFEHFMDAYSEITCTPRLNVGRACRAWKRLSLEERELALSNIEQYYNNLPDVHYCAQAATYLADKAFLIRYDY